MLQTETKTEDQPPDFMVNPPSQNERVLAEIRGIEALFQQKNDQYLESPVEILPVESWLHQIRIKAERALQAIDHEKREEELKDCAVYCLLTLAKIESNKKKIFNPVTGTSYQVRERTSKTPKH